VYQAGFGAWYLAVFESVGSIRKMWGWVSREALVAHVLCNSQKTFVAYDLDIASGSYRMVAQLF